jgi:hypothetical protein
VVETDFWKLLELLGQRYPALIPLLAKPGVFDVMRQAVDPGPDGNWPPERLKAALEATPYFQQTPQEQRTFDVLIATDPATGHQRVSDADRMVRTLQGQLGFPSSNDFGQFGLAVEAASQGWDETRTRMELVARSNGSQFRGPGGIGDQMTQFQKAADDYGVPMHHDDLYWWAANVQGGTQTPEAFRDYLTQQATNLYPVLAQPLAQGQTVREFGQAYLTTAANELGINPAEISLTNPKWTEVFLARNEKGEQTILDRNESLQKIRSDPTYGYDTGLPARTQAAQLATELRQQMGMQ